MFTVHEDVYGTQYVLFNLEYGFQVSSLANVKLHVYTPPLKLLNVSEYAPEFRVDILPRDHSQLMSERTFFSGGGS